MLPNEHIKVQNLGEGVMLTGDVSNPGIAIKATAIAQKFSPDGVTSMLHIGNSQVVLEVSAFSPRPPVDLAGDTGVVLSKSAPSPSPSKSGPTSWATRSFRPAASSRWWA